MKKMKKVVVLAITVCMLLGNVLTVAAAEQTCPPHAFIKEEYSHSQQVDQSHSYVFGYYDDGTVEYRTCHYYDLYHILNEVCAYCGLNSGKTVTVYAGQHGHICGQ